MKFAAALILSLVITSGAFAQSLFVNGVTLALGESELKARTAIQDAEMTISKEGFLSVKRGDLYDLCGAVSFKDGKVISIQREWFLLRTPNDKNVIANAFHSAMSSVLDGKESATCNVTLDDQEAGPSFGKYISTKIVCAGPNWNHLLVLTGADCSGGCSESVTSALVEIISEKNRPF